MKLPVSFLLCLLVHHLSATAPAAEKLEKVEEKAETTTQTDTKALVKSILAAGRDRYYDENNNYDNTNRNYYDNDNSNRNYYDNDNSNRNYYEKPYYTGRNNYYEESENEEYYPNNNDQYYGQYDEDEYYPKSSYKEKRSCPALTIGSKWTDLRTVIGYVADGTTVKITCPTSYVLKDGSTGTALSSNTISTKCRNGVYKPRVDRDVLEQLQCESTVVTTCPTPTVPPTVCCPTLTGWIPSVDGKKCFKAFAGPKTFDNANAACRNEAAGGFLASVRSAGDDYNIGVMVLETISWTTDFVFIGAKTTTAGVGVKTGWTWVDDGAALTTTYTNWNFDQPNNNVPGCTSAGLADTSQSCLGLRTVFGTRETEHKQPFGFDDQCCSKLLPYVCEQPATVAACSAG